MKILVLKQNVPWPIWSGKDLRTYHVLSRWNRTHDVTLACWEGDGKNLNKLPFRTILRPAQQLAGGDRGPAERDRITSHYGMFPGATGWLHNLINEYQPDVLFGVNYQTLSMLEGNPQRPRVCYLGDNHFLTALQYLRLQKGRRWRNFKETIWSYFLHRRFATCAEKFIFVTEQEAVAFRRFTDRPCVGIANGVDTDHFRTNGTPRGDKEVVFIGSLNSDPNLDAINWFCDLVWPRVRHVVPDAELTLVGKQPITKVLARDGKDGIHVVGDAPDLRPYMAKATAAVVPMRSGGGIKNKILEGWAMGLPMVATPMALPGTASRPNFNILVSNQPAQFADNVIRLLCEEKLRKKIGDTGRETVLREHTWDRTAAAIEQCLLDVIEAATHSKV